MSKHTPSNVSYKKSIRVWDLPTRLLHWGLVISIGYAWFAVEILEDMQQHFYAGYSVLTIILFRLAWGFAGSRYARFGSFFYTPTELINYTSRLFKGPSKSYLGHNPLGSLSALAMIFALLFQASTGLFSSDDYFHGPLSGLIESPLVSRISSLHSLNVDILIALVGLHIAAIMFYQFYKKEKLIAAMFTGRKPMPAEASQKHGITAPNLWLALLILIICIAFVYYLANAYLEPS